VGEPQTPPGAVPPTVVDAAAVRAQLERILVSGPFRNSKRYPALLRYVVEQELNGSASELKERTIAIDVFGRDPYYDPSADPVVRISAGEVRKRLAQYYQDAADKNELRIELPVGSYHPEFVAPAPVTAAAAFDLPAAAQIAAHTATQDKRKQTLLALGACLVLAVVAGLVWVRLANRATALELFWRPVIQQNHSVMLCLGRSGSGQAVASTSSRPIDPNQVMVAWWDAETFARVAAFIRSQGASVHLFREDQANFSDFQHRPAVLIGAFNDQWTMELMSRMRYTFQHNGNVQWIADRDHPKFQDWKNDLSQRDEQGNLALRQDYAIISRIANPRTGFITVTVAGLWGYGTLAAGEFLTDPKYLDELAKHSGLKLDKGDMQIVIGAEVIQGRPGPPKVLAVATW
jgi:hypothetical protein